MVRWCWAVKFGTIWYRGCNGNTTPPYDGEMRVRFLLVPQILKL